MRANDVPATWIKNALCSVKVQRLNNRQEPLHEAFTYYLHTWCTYAAFRM